MATTPTTGDIPSNAAVDLKFNSEQFDRVMNSDDLTYTDRFGKKRITMKGVQELANGFQDTFTNLLGSPDGFKLIGGVASFDALRSTPVKTEGQRIFLKSYYDGQSIGAGIFIGHIGTKLDDNGTVAQGINYYWERSNVGSINLYDYGVYLQSGSTIKATPGAAVDMTDRVQSAIAKSIEYGVPLRSSFYLGNDIDFVSKGIYLRKSLYLNGIKNMLGDYPFLSYSGVGVYDSDPGLSGVTGTAEPYVIFNMNADFDTNGKKFYGTNRGGQRIGKIVVYNLGGRNVHLNGQLHITKNSTFECLHSSQIKGTAVNMGTSFDYQITELGSHSSGDFNYFALEASIYPAADSMDEHNAFSITSLFSHDSYEHSVRILGSKGSVGRVHEEATQVNSTADYAGYGNAYGSVNGYGYTTSMIGGPGTVVGAYSVQALSTTVNPVVVTLGMYGTTFNHVNTSSKTSVATVSQLNSANSIGAIKITQGDLIINDQSRVMIGSCNIAGNLSFKDSRSTIGNLIQTGNITDLYGTIQRAQVTGNVTLHPLGVIDYGTVSGDLVLNQGWSGGNYARNLIVAGNMSIVNGGGTSAWFDNVVIRGTFTTSNGANLRLNGFRVDGASSLTGTSLNMEFNNSQFAAVTLDAAATGVWLFDMNAKATSFTGFKLPTTNPRVGSMTKNIPTGEVSIYLAGGWKTLIAAPA